MPFLNKKEQSLINVINADQRYSSDERSILIAETKDIARMRQDQYRPNVKMFLSVLSSLKADKLIIKTLR